MLLASYGVTGCKQPPYKLLHSVLICTMLYNCAATVEKATKHGNAIMHCIATTACALQADSTPPAMVAGGMVYSSDKCLNHTAESTTDVTDAMW